MLGEETVRCTFTDGQPCRNILAKLVRWSVACCFLGIALVYLAISVHLAWFAVPSGLIGLALGRRIFADDHKYEIALAIGSGLFFLSLSLAFALFPGQRLVLDLVCWDPQAEPGIRKSVAELAWDHGYRDLVYQMNRLGPEPDDPLGCPRFPEDW